LREAAVGLDEGLLRKIVGEGNIAARQMTDKIANSRLVAGHQFAKGRAVIGGDDADDEFGIRRRHVAAGGRRPPFLFEKKWR